MTIDRERARRFWDRQVTDQAYETDFGPGTLVKDRRLALCRKAVEEERLSRLIELEPHQTVLDIGCGTGRWAMFFSPRVRSVVGTDFSEAMIARAKAIAERQGAENVEFRVADATSLEGMPRADVVHAGGVLQYLSDEDVTTFAEAANSLLRPGGRLVTRDSVGPRRVVQAGEYPVVYRTELEYQELLSAAGFELERRTRASFIPVLLPRVMPIFPLPPLLARVAMELDGRLVRTWPMPSLLRLYSWLTGRGSGLVIDHRFAVWRPRAD